MKIHSRGWHRGWSKSRRNLGGEVGYAPYLRCHPRLLLEIRRKDTKTDVGKRFHAEMVEANNNRMKEQREQQRRTHEEHSNDECGKPTIKRDRQGELRRNDAKWRFQSSLLRFYQSFSFHTPLILCNKGLLLHAASADPPSWLMRGKEERYDLFRNAAVLIELRDVPNLHLLIGADG